MSETYENQSEYESRENQVWPPLLSNLVFATYECQHPCGTATVDGQQV